MTIGIAWVATRPNGREHLYLATDSRTRGGQIMDFCPKILTLPRSDCALCFAGDTYDTYPLMLQLASAIAAHEPSQERSIDVSRVKDHLLRIFTDLVAAIKEAPLPFKTENAQFIFAGYSWLRKDFRIWTIGYNEKLKGFGARESASFNHRLEKVAFIGDWAKEVRKRIAKEFSGEGKPLHLEPLHVLADLLKSSTRKDSIGGPPQLVRLTEHMNTRPLCVKWEGKDTLFGRTLFDYENTDYWSVDPFSGRFFLPRKFGHRDDESRDEDGKVSFEVK